MKLARIDYLFLFLLIVSFIAAMIFAVPRDPFDYDPSDYMFAASRGFAANYTDENAIPITTFIDMGMRSGRDSTARAGLSAFIRQSGDISLYRHYHAPLSFYYLVFVRNLFGDAEVTMRWSMLFLHILAALVVYAGCMALAGEKGRTAAVISSLLYLTSVINIETAFKVSPHALFVLLTLSTLFLLARMLYAGTRAGWYPAVALLCGAVLTFEYASVLAVVFLLVLLLHRKTLFGDLRKGELRRLLLRSAGAFILLFFLFWPAGIYKLTLVKNYIFIAYFALVRKENILTPGAAALWWDRFTHSPFEFLLLLAALGFILYRFLARKEYRWLSPFLLYIGFMLIVSAGNTLPNPTYVSSLFAALFVPAGIGLAAILMRWKSPLRIPAGIALSLLLLVNNTRHFLIREPDPSAWKRNCVISHLQREDVQGKSILVPKEFFPSAHYYFRESKVDWYDDTGGDASLAGRLKSRVYAEVFFLDKAGASPGERIETGEYARPNLLCVAPDGSEALYALTRGK